MSGFEQAISLSAMDGALYGPCYLPAQLWGTAMAHNNCIASNSFPETGKFCKRVAALSICVALAGCQGAEVLRQVALAGCGTSTAYLNNWWADLPEPAQVDHDPIGGYVFAYWIDDQGNVCSGDPGRNGEVGPAVVAALTPAAGAAIAANAPVAASELSAFQQIPVSFANYSASGPHLIQFYNTTYRTRSDGAVWTSRSNGVFASPIVSDIGQQSCFAPVANKVNQTVFLPSLPTSGTQDPVRCRVKAKPSPSGMSEQELQAIHIVDLPHGGNLRDIAP